MEISNYDDVIDSRDVIARIEELQARNACENCGEPVHVDDDGNAVHDHGDASCGAGDGSVAEFEPLDEDEAAELAALLALADEGENSAEDWQYGATLIRDSYFQEYAQELAEELDLIPEGNKWPTYCIDWEWAARELRVD